MEDDAVLSYGDSTEPKLCRGIARFIRPKEKEIEMTAVFGGHFYCGGDGIKPSP